MSDYSTLAYKVYHWLAEIPSKIAWSKKHAFTEVDKEQLAALLATGYYIILTGNRSHLSSVLVCFLSWIKTGVWAQYSHALMNCDNITDPNDRNSFKFIEATSVGVHLSTFDEITKCDTLCVLTPKNISNAEWTAIIDALVKQQGTPYDDLFDLTDTTHISCVESVLNALKAADYADDFSNLAAMISDTGNLVPQMYRNCPDFIVTFEK